MFKVFFFVRRQPHLSREEFVELFEGSHVPLVAQLVADGIVPAMADYRRNYLLKGDELNTRDDVDFDAIVEVWFNARSEIEANRAAHRDPESERIMKGSLSRCADVTASRYIVVEEYIGGDTAPAVRG